MPRHTARGSHKNRWTQCQEVPRFGFGLVTIDHPMLCRHRHGVISWFEHKTNLKRSQFIQPRDACLLDIIPVMNDFWLWLALWTVSDHVDKDMDEPVALHPRLSLWLAGDHGLQLLPLRYVTWLVDLKCTRAKPHYFKRHANNLGVASMYRLFLWSIDNGCANGTLMSHCLPPVAAIFATKT